MLSLVSAFTITLAFKYFTSLNFTADLDAYCTRHGGRRHHREERSPHVQFFAQRIKFRREYLRLGGLRNCQIRLAYLPARHVAPVE